MKIGKRIKDLRDSYQYSQDELADKVYVSRQTISNWENNKNYPDINSLLLIATLFNVTLDTLVKGDIEEMKEQIKETDIKKFDHESIIFSILLISMIILPVPLFKLLDTIGIVLWVLLVVISFYYASRVEKLKKQYDIQTYKEITAFMDKKQLDNNQKNQEKGKVYYQKFLMAIGAGLLTLIVAFIMNMIIK